MRLLNTSTLKLEEFIGSKVPPYAILSHRWEEVEFTYKDAVESSGTQSTHAKIRGCCLQASRDGYRYIWVDSCCIDKSSSAELSEAINSMFKWYRESEVCYAYLSDVPDAGDDHARADSPFRRSRWFTRGWTLQELLAPRKLVFCDRGWVRLLWVRPGRQPGMPALRLDKLVEEITGIGELAGWEGCSVAQKMSWASRRETTREEDMAYCLLGLFGVNMPPLYGEGEQAFLRLQLEILKMSDDESIFAWTDDKNPSDGGLLAASPTAFRDSGNVEKGKWDSPSYSMTNKGLSISLRLMKHWNNLTSLAADDALLAPLNCSRRNQLGQLAVILKKVGKDQYARTLPSKLLTMRELPHAYASTARTGLYIRQPSSSSSHSHSANTPPHPPFQFFIPVQQVVRCGYRISEKYLTHPRLSRWDADATGQYVLTLSAQEICGALVFADQQREGSRLVVVVDVRLNCPGADVFVVKGSQGGARSYCDVTQETRRRDEVRKRFGGGGGGGQEQVVVVKVKERGIFSRGQFAVDITVGVG